ncbi:MAG: Flp pilus assembly complex ATPase component TadA [Sandaracinus sp.]|nr:Flp pilus assembly complex ATPase component TadA [Sandaracinus sp.]
MFAVVITEKGGAQRRMEFDKNEVTIGRVQGNDIILPKGNVSKRHSRIVLKDNRFIVVDLKSTNGTYVNGRKITSPLVVKPGDKVYIGDFIITVEGLDGAGASAPPAGPPGMGAGGPPPMPQPSGGPPPMPAPQPMGGPPPMPAPQPIAPQPAPQPIAAPAPQAAPPPMPAPQPMAPPARSRRPPRCRRPNRSPRRMPAPQPAPAPAAEPVRRGPPPLRSSPPPAPQPTPAPMSRPQAPRASSPPPADDFSRSEPPTSGPPRRSAPAAIMATSMETPEGLPAVLAALAKHYPALDYPGADVLEDGKRHEDARQAVAAALRDAGVDGDADLGEAALAEAVGLGAFAALLADDSLSEIVVEGPDRVLVDRGAGLVPSEASFSSAKMLAVCARRLVARSGGSAEGAVLQAWLPEGGFATVLLPPVAIGGPIVEIRKGVGVTLDTLVARGAVSEAAATVLRSAVEARRNVVVLGVADAGVSEVLSAIAAAIDPSERLVAVGAGAPLDLPNVVSLAGGGATGTSLGAVAQQAARLRADHMLVDGVCDGSAIDVLAALGAHGGGGFVGVHAPAAREPGAVLTLLARLAGRATEETVAALVGDVAHLVVTVERGESGPRVSSIVELGAAEGTRVASKPLFSSQGDVLVPTGTAPSF